MRGYIIMSWEGILSREGMSVTWIYVFYRKYSHPHVAVQF